MTRVTGLVLRQREYWMGWPGAAYPVEDFEREYPEKAKRLAQSAEVDLKFSETVYDNNGLRDFIRTLETDRPDGLLLILLSMEMWKMVDQIADCEIPTVVFAPVGTAFTGHVVDRSRRKGLFLISSLEMDEVGRGLEIIDAKRKIAGETLLVLKGDSQKPKDSIVDGLGLTIRTVGKQEVVETYHRIGETEEVKAIAEEYAGKARRVIEPQRDDIIKAARMYLACRSLLKKYEATAITMDCLGLIGSRLIDTTPCMAFSRLNDEGTPAACEADIDALLTMVVLKHLYGKPSFMNDPVPETVKNLLIAAHCTCATRLNGYEAGSEPFTLRSHSESNMGVSMQVHWREGQEITLAKFQGPEKMIIGSGTVVGNVETPPAGGCRTSVEVRMKEVKDVRDTKGFHQLLFYGDLAGDLRNACQLMGIETAEI